MNTLSIYKKSIFLLVAVMFVLTASKGSTQNNVFKAGEKISYDLYYNWGLIWINAGRANFSVMSTTYKEKPSYYLSATGHSLKSFDKFYFVRDTLATIVEKESFLPKYHKRIVREDSYRAKDEYWFRDIGQNKTTVTTHCHRKKGFNIDTLTLNNNVTDLVTAIYKIRNSNFKGLKKNESLPFSIIIDDDDEQFNLSLKYLGKEKIKLHNGRKYNCIKLRPQLITGSVFKDEDAMTVWITDDKNRIPVMIETKIRVGSLKVMLKSVSNTKYPFNAEIK